MLTSVTSRVSKCFPQIARLHRYQISFRSSNFEQTTRFFSLSATVMGKKVALVLAGCGVYDGTELHEASACMVHLSRVGAEVTTFAPDKPQMHTVNHITGAADAKDNRNVLIESARIARGPVQDIKTLHAADFSAVVFPGGFGAAKNLSDFAVKNKDCTVDPEVKRVINEFKGTKPIGRYCVSPVVAVKLLDGCELTISSHIGTDGGGIDCVVTMLHIPGPSWQSSRQLPTDYRMRQSLCCISPVLAAKVLDGCELTIGSDKGTADAINAMGGKHVVKKVNAYIWKKLAEFLRKLLGLPTLNLTTDLVEESHVDKKLKVVTTPAFMASDAKLHEIHEGIGTMIDAVIKMA